MKNDKNEKEKLKAIWVSQDTHQRLGGLKVSCKAKNFDMVIEKLIALWHQINPQVADEKNENGNSSE